MKTAEEMYQYCLDNGYGEGMNRKWGIKHFTLIQDSLSADEDALMCFIGLHNYQSATKHDNNYAYTITNKRIIMAQKKVIGESIQTVAINNLNDITLKTGMVFGVITIDTMKEVFNIAIAKQHARNINEKIHDLLLDLQSQKTAPMQAQATQTSSADEILKLKNLMDMGAITEDEFNAKKKQLLGL